MTSPIDTPHGRRLPVLFAFVAIAVAAFLLSAGGAAVASSHSIRPARDTSRAGPAAAAEEEVEEEVEWEWEEEPEEGEASGGEAAAAQASPSKTPATACPLPRVSARAIASDTGDTLRLALKYSSSTPSTVTVRYWLRGAKGVLRFASLTRRMRSRGSIELVERLDARAMAKVRLARVFIVEVDAPGVPRNCERNRTHRLSTRRRAGRRTTWSQPPRFHASSN